MEHLILAIAMTFLASTVAAVIAVHRADCRRNRAIVEQLSSSVIGSGKYAPRGLRLTPYEGVSVMDRRPGKDEYVIQAVGEPDPARTNDVLRTLAGPHTTKCGRTDRWHTCADLRRQPR